MNVRTLNRFIEEFEALFETQPVAIAASLALVLFLLAEFK